jgi:F0F1-type ATP synthase gamma subunit
MIKVAFLALKIFLISQLSDSRFVITDDSVYCGEHLEAINKYAEEFLTTVSSQTELCALYFVNLKNKSQFSDEEKESKAGNFMRLTEETIGDAYSELILKIAQELNLDSQYLTENLENGVEGSGFEQCAYANVLAAKVESESRLDKLRELYYETRSDE